MSQGNMLSEDDELQDEDELEELRLGTWQASHELQMQSLWFTPPGQRMKPTLQSSDDDEDDDELEEELLEIEERARTRGLQGLGFRQGVGNGQHTQADGDDELDDERAQEEGTRDETLEEGRRLGISLGLPQTAMTAGTLSWLSTEAGVPPTDW